MRQSQETASQRRPYRKPAVRAYGDLAALTRMAVGARGVPDGGSISMMQRTGL